MYIADILAITDLSYTSCLLTNTAYKYRVNTQENDTKSFLNILEERVSHSLSRCHKITTEFIVSLSTQMSVINK